MICPRGHAELSWIELSGVGVIQTVTHGSGKLPFDDQQRRLVLALIAMEGAHNLTLGRIDTLGDVKSGNVVRLIPDLMIRGGQAWSAVFESMPFDSLERVR